MSFSETTKKEKKRYIEDDLRKALNDVREQKSSIRQICKEYGIPKTIIFDKISGHRPDGVKKPRPELALRVDGAKR